MVETVFVYDHPDALPPDAVGLFASPGQDLYGTADWYRIVIAAALPLGAVPCFVLVRLHGQPAAVVALQSLADGTLQSLTTPYTCLFRPLIAPGVDATGLHAIGKALARLCRSFDSLRLDAMDADWPGLAPFRAGLRAGGLIPLRFDHFGNWHEPVEGLSWAAYLATRNGALRETIRRRTARIARDPAIRFELYRTPAEIGPGIGAFEDVYARSWKEPEPYPRFNARLIGMAASLGVLRLAVMWHGDTPIAVQLWVVTGSTATVLKLAHDEAFKPLSPGTVLTAHVIAALLDAGGVSELDFGRGDDPYKRGWASCRRQRIGLVLVDPWTVAGLLVLGRHWVGRVRRILGKGFFFF